MTTENYAEFVDRLLAPGAEALERISVEQLEQLHCALGVAGESGELADAVKKSIFYNRPIDRENVLEEAGDILFYLPGRLSTTGFTLGQAIAANKEKLGRRYPAGYSHAAAALRADKVNNQ